MTAREAAGRWAREWERAWREHDAERVGALYADGASFRTGPFREPQEPAAYAAWAFASEEPGGDIRFGEPVVAGDDRAAVEWWAVVREPGGSETTIAGVSLLRFDDDGLVVEERGYWTEDVGRREPHEGWGS
ncbi:MAG: nuclear transport factor 2 family protein [Pseudomonadota bacterium]